MIFINCTVIRGFQVIDPTKNYYPLLQISRAAGAPFDNLFLIPYPSQRIDTKYDYFIAFTNQLLPIPNQPNWWPPTDQLRDSGSRARKFSKKAIKEFYDCSSKLLLSCCRWFELLDVVISIGLAHIRCRRRFPGTDREVAAGPNMYHYNTTGRLVSFMSLLFFGRFLEEQPTSASACDTNVYQYNILFSGMFLPSESWWIFYSRQQCWQHLRGNLLTWPRVCIRFIPRRLDNQLDVVRVNPPSSLHPIRNAENNNEKLKKKNLTKMPPSQAGDVVIISPRGRISVRALWSWKSYFFF